jgi:uncharacterized damage-inducible protein DinB
MNPNTLIMKKLLLIAVLFSACFSYAQENLTQNTIKAVLTGNQDQVLQLAEAFPEEKYDWRPSEGVNSVGEAFLHVASANYFFASKLGFAPPEDIDMMSIGKITGKENIISALKKSNEFVRDIFTKVEDDSLDDEVDFGFMKMNTLSGLLIIMEHNGEHKGQLIAYARSNGIVPPWSK